MDGWMHVHHELENPAFGSVGQQPMVHGTMVRFSQWSHFIWPMEPGGFGDISTLGASAAGDFTHAVTM